MHSDIASEIWAELKRYIPTSDREEVADILVNVLINNDEDVSDIRAAFSGDPEVRRVLSAYTDQDDAEDDDDNEDDYEELDY